MSFIINGNISGSTFNNVGGDMHQITGDLTQIFNSHGHHPSTGSAGPIGGRRATMTDYQSGGVIRTQRRVQRNHSQPYDTTGRRYLRVGEESEDLYQDNNGPQNDMDTTRDRSSTGGIAPDQNAGTTEDDFMQRRLVQQGEILSANTYHVGGNMTQLRSYGESGLDILYRFVAMGATHESGERYVEPACHPGTRVAVLEQLTTWADDTRPESSILWLHGSAGMGKSAIAQMFAGNCNNKGQLGASFFFKRGDPERGSWHRLFTTIAFQLAHSVPGLLIHVQHAVEVNKLVIKQAKELQFQRLIVEPLKKAPVPQLLPILVLDGLDECEDPKVQQEILWLVVDAIHTHQLPIRILIASRPEPHIHGVLQTKLIFNLCRLLELSADYTAYEDIRKYLCDEFSRIRMEYSAAGIDLEDMWPSPEVIGHLKRKSSGIFIYAITAIRFVGDLYSGSHPQERLNSLLSLDPESTTPLDDLYTQILSVVKRNDQQLHILHVIWQSKSSLQSYHPDPEEIDLLLDLRCGTSRLALHCLHSLLKVPPIASRFEYPSIEVNHASFTDFLGDPRRSKGCNTVVALPKILNNVTPCDQLFNVLRNTVFQDSLFLTSYCNTSWPQNGSLYPSDLIQLWDCHKFTSTLVKDIEHRNQKECFPTFKYDSLYTKILSGQSTLIFILSTQVTHLWLDPILRLFDLSYRIFEPFFPFRKQLDFPLPEGDSPADFIVDPYRAGVLYMEPQTVAETVVLQWIVRAREFVVAGDYFPALWVPFLLQPDIAFKQDSRYLFQFIEVCGNSSKILDELATLDLSKICDQISDEQTFPEPPQEVINFWQTQIAAIQQCEDNLWEKIC
ncbi:hypothetical protein C8J57DRAFT_1558722 [Mycena rebaudengoi]|nr:hypothetical protein C8J57DRAFT_1558722 [Mycena rebaudengoi]